MPGPQRERWSPLAPPREPERFPELSPESARDDEVVEHRDRLFFLRERRWRRSIAVGAGVAVAALLSIFTSSTPSGEDTPPQQKSALEQAFELQSAGRIEQAAVLYRKVVDEDPTSVVAYFNLGVIENTLGLAEESAQSYGKVLEIDPGHIPALYNLAILRTAAGDADGAIDLYRRVIALDPNQATSLLNLGILLLKSGDEIGASEYLGRAIQLNPSLSPDGAAGLEASTTPVTDVNSTPAP